MAGGSNSSLSTAVKFSCGCGNTPGENSSCPPETPSTRGNVLWPPSSGNNAGTRSLCATGGLWFSPSTRGIGSALAAFLLIFLGSGTGRCVGIGVSWFGTDLTFSGDLGVGTGFTLLKWFDSAKFGATVSEASEG